MVFEDNDLSTMGRAFDRAWDLFLRRGLLTVHNLDVSRQFIAKQILEKARAGDRDEWKLARNALAHWSDFVQNRTAIVGALRRHRSPGREVSNVALLLACRWWCRHLQIPAQQQSAD